MTTLITEDTQYRKEIIDKDEVLKMATKVYGECDWHESALHHLEAFAKLVAAKEREACAEICDRFQARDVGMQPAECAGAIRARSEATLRGEAT